MPTDNNGITCKHERTEIVGINKYDYDGEEKTQEYCKDCGEWLD